MLKFRPGAGAIVAADTKNAVAAVDDAFLNGLRMLTSVVEAAQGSNLPITQSQRLYSGMTEGLADVLSGRQKFASAITQLTAIKERSEFEGESFGCPEGWNVSGSVAAEPAAAKLTVA